MLTLTKQEIEMLKSYFNEMPTKYGAQLLAFIIKKEQEIKEKLIEESNENGQ